MRMRRMRMMDLLPLVQPHEIKCWLSDCSSWTKKTEGWQWRPSQDSGHQLRSQIFASTGFECCVRPSFPAFHLLMQWHMRPRLRLKQHHGPPMEHRNRLSSQSNSSQMGIFQLCNAPAAYVAAPKERQLCVGGRGSIVLGMVSNSLKEGRLLIDEWLHISIGHLVKNLNWAHWRKEYWNILKRHI